MDWPATRFFNRINPDCHQQLFIKDKTQVRQVDEISPLKIPDQRTSTQSDFRTLDLDSLSSLS
ncbi:hypothetical protein RBSWK_01475 [Rhodopirellula baltica SWK14]|uniref:Uncharacterized protein n=1 Tax=Rhodopirellula baltica SWK14 TaxID=993516 RepID=L7CNE6_RHOBT|nr:hypothetical protein RBSWK_01475 [Rhodopirellula baltica SWK14]